MTDYIEKWAESHYGSLRKQLDNQEEVKEMLASHGIDIAKVPCGAYAGHGWISLIDNLIRTLVGLGWDKDLQQIKEKFGGLRFYVGNFDSEMREAIKDAYHFSEKTCEACGDEGTIKAWRPPWYKCFCSSCGEAWANRT